MSTSPADLDPATTTNVRERPSAFAERLLSFSMWDFQAEFADGEGWRALRCGRQVGKSRTLAALALHAASTTPDATVLVVAPVQRQSSELFSQVKKEIADSPIPAEAWGVDRETRTLLGFSNGARIVCLPAGSDGRNIRAFTADLVIVDEAAFVPMAVFEDALEPMLATTDGDLVLASTPFGTRGYFYEACHDAAFEEHYAPMRASPLVDEEFIERQRERKSAMSFSQEVLGEFVEDADGLIPRSHITASVASETPPERLSDPVYLGVDIARFGGDDSVFVSLDAAGNVFDLDSTNGMATTDAVGRVKRLHESTGYEQILVDETGLGGGVVDQLQESLGSSVVEGVTFTLNSKQDVYGALQSAFEDGALSLPDDRSMVQQLAELEYEYTSSGKMKVSHPEGGHDDYPDALGLANWARVREEFSGPRRSTRSTSSRVRSRS